jgi:hypothetical protein
MHSGMSTCNHPSIQDHRVTNDFSDSSSSISVFYCKKQSVVEILEKQSWEILALGKLSKSFHGKEQLTRSMELPKVR